MKTRKGNDDNAHIAAHYLGSQFRLFALEHVVDSDALPRNMRPIATSGSAQFAFPRFSPQVLPVREELQKEGG